MKDYCSCYCCWRSWSDFVRIYIKHHDVDKKLCLSIGIFFCWSHRRMKNVCPATTRSRGITNWKVRATGQKYGIWKDIPPLVRVLLDLWIILMINYSEIRLSLLEGDGVIFLPLRQARPKANKIMWTWRRTQCCVWEQGESSVVIHSLIKNRAKNEFPTERSDCRHTNYHSIWKTRNQSQTPTASSYFLVLSPSFSCNKPPEKQFCFHYFFSFFFRPSSIIYFCSETIREAL
jgi:hypothetical protein